MPKSENLWFEVEMFDLIKPKAWPIFLFLSRFKRVVVNKLEFTFFESGVGLLRAKSLIIPQKTGKTMPKSENNNSPISTWSFGSSCHMIASHSKTWRYHYENQNL